MWIVIVVAHYYPSVFHFDNEEEARKCYEKNKEELYTGHAIHFVEVKASKYYKEQGKFGLDKAETLDVRWYSDR
ncbi:hypothetical protein C2145_11190 [Bacillus velezensis]|uniref:hypothetical protein n=1 Tax=Bacillus velezensis TaxID=492670 RepID=UPI000CD5793A|nr:hypothetical protein [Bacillus velezensis]POI16642.1 hypothetical protein C2145_11190 [Bacillus velezensis]